jgi:hypothetical protein
MTAFDIHVRMNVDHLRQLTQEHLYSEIEDVTVEDSHEVLSGYTEWRAASDQKRDLSFAWDWTYQRDAATFLAQWSSLRTNLRLVGELGEDLAAERMQACIAQIMIKARWDSSVASHLGLPVSTGSG